MQPSPPAIYLNNASLNYAGEQLFNNLNVCFHAGKINCLLGPSGVGKTSLLRFIANLHQDSKTTITGTIQTSDQLSLKGRISYMSQNDLLLPWLSTIQNVLLGYRLRSESISHSIQQQAYALLTAVGLKNIAKKHPQQLSGGMRQRVALARTLMEKRPVVLLDEPFASLDSITRIQLQDLIAASLENQTVILVTHDPLEALRLSHHIFVMSHRPARIEEFSLPSSPPRSSTDPSVLQLQSLLLQQLLNAQGSLI